MTQGKPVFGRAGRGSSAVATEMLSVPTTTSRGEATWGELDPRREEGLRFLRVAIEQGAIDPALARVHLCVEPWPSVEEVTRWLDSSKSTPAMIRRAGLRVVRGGGKRGAHVQQHCTSETGCQLSLNTEDKKIAEMHARGELSGAAYTLPPEVVYDLLRAAGLLPQPPGRA
jgi:hypothetical protein